MRIINLSNFTIDDVSNKEYYESILFYALSFWIKREANIELNKITSEHFICKYKVTGCANGFAISAEMGEVKELILKDNILDDVRIIFFTNKKAFGSDYSLHISFEDYSNIPNGNPERLNNIAKELILKYNIMFQNWWEKLNETKVNQNNIQIAIYDNNSAVVFCDDDCQLVKKHIQSDYIFSNGYFYNRE